MAHAAARLAERVFGCGKHPTRMARRRSAAAALAWLLVLPSCLARKCGQPEIDARSIEGCTSFEHLRLLHHGALVRAGAATPCARRAMSQARAPPAA